MSEYSGQYEDEDYQVAMTTLVEWDASSSENSNFRQNPTLRNTTSEDWSGGGESKFSFSCRLLLPTFPLLTTFA